MILVPVKDFADAKSRLASVLSRAEREELARAMFADVLSVLGQARHPLLDAARPAAIGIVTRDSAAMAIAREVCPAGQYEIIADAKNAGETQAIAAATEVAMARGAEFTLVVPGDAPLVTASEIECILSCVKEQGCVLCPDEDGEGTNAILRRPAGLFPLQFGNHSFRPHMLAAIACRKPVLMMRLPGLALDVDRPLDLLRLAKRKGATRAQKLAAQWGLLERLHLNHDGEFAMGHAAAEAR